MVKYILRLLGFLALCVCVCAYATWGIIFGDIRETWNRLTRNVPIFKADFGRVLRGESFL